MFIKFAIFGIFWSVFPIFTHALKLPKSLLINSSTLHHLESTVEAFPTASGNDKGQTDTNWKDTFPSPMRWCSSSFLDPRMTTHVLSLGSYWATWNLGDAKSLRALVGTGSSTASRPQVGRFWINQHWWKHTKHCTVEPCRREIHRAGAQIETFLFCHFVNKIQVLPLLDLKKRVCLRLVDRPLKQIPEENKILISKQYIQNLHWGAFRMIQHQQPFLRGQ